MRYAIVAEGSVTNIVEASEEFATGQGWIEADESAVIGGTWSEAGGFVPPVVVTVPPSKADLRNALEQKRQEVQDAGFAWNGYQVACDTRSLGLLLGLRSKADRDGESGSYSFFDELGQRAEIASAQAVALVEAAEDFVQGTFTTAGTIADQIESETVTTVEAVRGHAAWG